MEILSAEIFVEFPIEQDFHRFPMDIYDRMNASDTVYDVIVVGTGGVGSSAVYHLAKKGFRVLGLDRFPAGHDRGSSHGHTRVIRKAYFEHPDYVPMLTRAYQLWADLESETRKSLFIKHDLVEIGPGDGVVVPGILQAATEHGLQVDSLSKIEFAKQYPALKLPKGYLAVRERDAGFLYVEPCVRAHLDLAKNYGATLQQQPLANWKTESEGITVTTEDGTIYQANSLVITGGSWAASLLNNIPNLNLKVLRKHLHWFESDQSTHIKSGFPLYLYELPIGCFYGFPNIEAQGCKVAEHSGGETIVNPLKQNTGIDPEDSARVCQFVENYISGVSRKRTRHETCYYTMTPDGNFIIDHHPENPAVVFAAGLSGHGFKFTSVIGEILANMATGRSSTLPVDFLGLKRFE